jgi:hypothetical protein
MTGHHFTIRTMTDSRSLLGGHKSRDLYRRKFFHVHANHLGFHKIHLSTRAVQKTYLQFILHIEHHAAPFPFR